MKAHLITLALTLGVSPLLPAQGLLLPEDRKADPVAMVSHRVNVVIEDQAAATKVEQTFRNTTGRPMEAVYVFPVPRGASVREFAMWVDGKRVNAELLEAAKARQVYNDIVRRLKDPGLLEYAGCDLLRLSAFPIPARGEQKVELSYTYLAPQDAGVVEYTYPVRTDGRSCRTLEDFSLKVTLRSQHPIYSVYSPTHRISIARPSDREAIIGFEKNQAMLDRDFQLFYAVGGREVGLTALSHRSDTTEDGYFLLLISPRAELPESCRVPRDLVLVLDTSGSMAENGKLGQAKAALKHSLSRVTECDRFAILTFATTVNRYADSLLSVNAEQTAKALKWIERIEAGGGTAIDDALTTALETRGSDANRTCTIAFFTDGKPTMGVTDIEKILANVSKRNTAQTRIFSFGVGHGVNATLLDRLAEETRGASTYVLPNEDLEAKASAFFDKVSRPVLADLNLSSGKAVRLLEVYPPKLPDLFHGGQLVVAGRYQGSGDVAIRLRGRLGPEEREFVFETHFPNRADAKPFVEDLWARRKVGYLLEEIRRCGENRELVDAVTALAKKYGIATPYTSWLVVPDMPVPIATPRPIPRPWREPPPLVAPGTPGGPPRKVSEVARAVQTRPADLADNRARFEAERFARIPSSAKDDPSAGALFAAREARQTFDAAQKALKAGTLAPVQADRLAVELSLRGNALKNQNQLQQSAVRQAAGRNLQEIGGVWIDDGFDAKRRMVTVQAMSDGYFRLLERQPQLREVFRLGNHLVWITPNGTALVIDESNGKETLADDEIDVLFQEA